MLLANLLGSPLLLAINGGRKTNSSIRTDPLALGVWSSMSDLGEALV